MIPFVILDELKDNTNEFLKKNALWIALVIVGVILITVAIILILNRKPKKEQPKIAEKSEWVNALGGQENITSSEAYGSRLVVVLVDKSKMDKDKLKELGVSNLIEMSNKATLVLEDKAELVKQELDK